MRAVVLIVFFALSMAATQAQSPEELEALTRTVYSDRTSLYYLSGSGPHVEYTAADGEVYLWLAGNSLILRGQWKVESNDTVQICFRYLQDTETRARKQFSSWACHDPIVSGTYIWETAAGDILGLSQRVGAPFMLGEPTVTLDELAARVPERIGPQ